MKGSTMLSKNIMSLAIYERLHRDHPTNLETVSYLITTCKELGRPYDSYVQIEAKLKRAQAQGEAATGLSSEAGGSTPVEGTGSAFFLVATLSS